MGYELRFGGSIDLGDPSMDAKATSALLVEAFGDIGLETLAGRHPAWVTIARNFLVEIGPPPVRPDRAVLQIKAYSARDDLLAILQKLSRSGYTIALDEWEGEMAANWRLSASSGHVTVDLPQSQKFELDANSNSGNIDVHFPIGGPTRVDRHSIRGAVAGGGPLLRVRTSSGGISIR